MNQHARQLGKQLWQFGTTSACWAVLLSVAACGQAPLSDDQAGFIDLVPFYPGTAANPNAGLPMIVAPKRGWIAGARIEYYDFGPVGNVRKRNNAGAEIRDPAYANVFPMYFFFDAQGRPMSSKPAYNSQTGNWHMLGGKNPVNPTPEGAPAAGQERSDYYRTVYLRRPRAVLADEARGSSEFQRPVIDTLSVNATTANTTGLWEIVEITVNDSNYRPDAIKNVSTITKGLADGRLSRRNTGKVINCPLIDERTNIIPSAMANNIPRPRIQYWYRQKMGECFLANGWETLGEVIDENQSAKDPANLRLFGTADLAKRVSTFDSFDFDVGAGQPGEMHAVVAAVGKLYTPTLTVGSGKNRYANDDLGIALPRHKATDPAGYSPIAWLWDINVPQAPAYQPGSIKDIVNVDLAGATARDTSPTVTTSNIAILGPANKCVADADCKWGMTCNLMPDDTVATSLPDPGLNIVDMMIIREGGPRCDVPVVGYGQYCGAGVSRCDVQATVAGNNDTSVKALGVTVAGPTFTVHGELATATTTLMTATTTRDTAMTTRDTAQTALTTAQTALADAMAAMPVDMAAVTAAQAAVTTAMTAATAAMTALTTAQTAVTTADNNVMTLTARVKAYDDLGYTKDFSGFGYFCYPPVLGTSNPPTLGGFCHIRCDAGASATASMVTVDLPLSSGGTFQNVFAGEARCGGLNMLGYRCLPTSNADRQRVCMRSCNVRNTVAQNTALCDYQLTQKVDVSGNPIGYSFSNAQPIRRAITGQMCAPVASTCNWNAEFEPRDPSEWGGR